VDVEHARVVDLDAHVARREAGEVGEHLCAKAVSECVHARER